MAALAVASGGSVAAAPAKLVALAPPAGGDARDAVAIGPAGEVDEPDGKGAWVRHHRISTATTIERAGRAGATVVAAGEGVVYRLAANGWSALRLVQKGKATVSGTLALAGRQLFALDRIEKGTPAKLALAPSNVVALGPGKKPVVATDKGLFRVDGAKLVAIAKAPKRVDALVGDRFALVGKGIVELATGKLVPWPAGLDVEVTSPTPEGLVAVARARGGLELVTLRAGKLAREPIEVTPVGTPVGVAVDKSGRAVVALRDGRIALRERDVWTIAAVGEAFPAAHPGNPPATGP